MQWQDIVLSIGQYIFALALLPSIFGNDKPALLTCLLTGAILGTFGIVYATLGLWSSVISAVVLTFAWIILAYQQYRRRG